MWPEINFIPRDFPEDFNNENGKYLCTCRICHLSFVGHKKRIICKECLNKENKVTLQEE